MTEQWKPIVGYEGFYEISDMGRVRSVSRRLCNGHYWRGRARKLQSGSGGYSSINLCRDGEEKTYMVHGLVLEAFVGIRPDGMECCHSDGNKKNNSTKNLRWDTSANNGKDMIAHKTTYSGSRHWKTKLCELDVWLIRNCDVSGRKMAEFLGITEGSVSLIRSRKTWATF